MHIKHVSNVTFLSCIQQIKEMPNVVKISGEINTMQNINILNFCSFTVLNKLKALQLSIYERSIDHQASTQKKADTMDRSHLNHKHMKIQIVCKNLFTKGVQNVHHLHGHMPGDAFFTGQLQCQ